ncbi:MAG: hypothetical protein P8R54_15930 [Myxococcota bacterium]|nr:hypothetical protein [Myxococcota bacterium]
MHSDDHRSLLLLIGLLALYAGVGINWRHLLDTTQGPDWLLIAIWLLMTGLLIRAPRLRRDLPLALVAMGGGAVIEWWGTSTALWTYFTKERPPLWILPAWPIAAIAIDRLCQISCRVLPALARTGAAYWVVIPSFIIVMSRFMWPSIHHPASWVVVALMVLVMAVGVKRDRDMALFIVGASAGIFLEYWGTSRRCWTYYSQQTPPIEAILAHGFASIAFARGTDLLGQRGRVVAWMHSLRSTQRPASS